MKQPSILDVVQGVKTVAPAHPEVHAWWYTPPQRLRLAGELPRSTGPTVLSIEVVVEGRGAQEIPCERIAEELSVALKGAAVAVRVHCGDREQRQLFRIVSTPVARSTSEAPRPA